MIEVILFSLAAIAAPNNLCKKSDLPDCHTRAVDIIEEGTDDDDIIGVEMLEKACGWGYGPSCEIRGILLVNGKIFEVDRAEAVDWFERGCEAGTGASCNRAGVQRDKEDLEITDRARALTLFEKACELGEPWGCFNAGDKHMKKDTPAYDVVVAENLLTKGCDGDNADACNSLGVLFATHLDQRDRALEPVVRACELDHGQACTNAWHLTPDTDVLGSLSRWEYAHQGCTLGNEAGCDVIGYDGPIEGTWRVVGLVANSHPIPFAEWLHSKSNGTLEWGAEQWEFHADTVTVTRFQGKRVRDEHWVGEVAATVGWQNRDGTLVFDYGPGGIGEFAFGDGDELIVNFWNEQELPVFRSYHKGSLSCEGRACRREIVLAIDDRTLLRLTPELHPIDLKEEVPW